MTSQPDHSEKEEQPDQTSEEPESESLIDDPDFYRGGASLAVTSPSGFAEPYLVRNRARVVQSWAQKGTPVKGICALVVIVGAVLFTAMLLLNKGALIG